MFRWRRSRVGPQIAEKTVEMVTSASHERVQRTVEHVPVPQLRDGTVEEVTLITREQVQQRTVEQSVDAPQFPEETVEGGEVSPT